MKIRNILCALALVMSICIALACANFCAEAYMNGYALGRETVMENLNSSAPETNPDWYAYPVESYSDYDRGCIDTIELMEVWKDPDNEGQVILSVNYPDGEGLEQYCVPLKEFNEVK